MIYLAATILQRRYEKLLATTKDFKDTDTNYLCLYGKMYLPDTKDQFKKRGGGDAWHLPLTRYFPMISKSDDD